MLYPFFVVVMPLFCIALGFWVATVRVADAAASLLLALLLSIAAFIGTSPRTLFGNTDAVQPLFTGYRVFFSNCIPISLVLFAIAFPDRLALDRRLPWVKWLVFAPLLLRIAAGGLVVALMLHNLALLQPHRGCPHDDRTGHERSGRLRRGRSAA